MDWQPNPDEVKLLNYWFDSLADGSGNIGGLSVVKFLQATNLSREILRSIWDLVDVAKKGTIDRKQFIKLMRITSICIHTPLPQGYYPNEHIYQSTLEKYYPLPNLLGHATVTSVQSASPAPVSHPQYQHHPHASPHPPPYPHMHSSPAYNAYPRPYPAAPGYPPSHYPPPGAYPSQHALPYHYPPVYSSSGVPSAHPGFPGHSYNNPATPSHLPPHVPTATSPYTVANATGHINPTVHNPVHSPVNLAEEDFNDFESAPTASTVHNSDPPPPTPPPAVDVDPFSDLSEPSVDKPLAQQASSTAQSEPSPHNYDPPKPPTSLPASFVEPITQRADSSLGIHTVTGTTRPTLATAQPTAAEAAFSTLSSYDHTATNPVPRHTPSKPTHEPTAIPVASTAHSTTTIGDSTTTGAGMRPAAISDRMHILDELIEADLRIDSEQWDDFADGSYTQQQPPPVDAVVDSVDDTRDHNSDPTTAYNTGTAEKVEEEEREVYESSKKDTKHISSILQPTKTADEWDDFVEAPGGHNSDPSDIHTPRGASPVAPTSPYTYTYNYDNHDNNADNLNNNNNNTSANNMTNNNTANRTDADDDPFADLTVPNPIAYVSTTTHPDPTLVSAGTDSGRGECTYAGTLANLHTYNDEQALHTITDNLHANLLESPPPPIPLQELALDDDDEFGSFEAANVIHSSHIQSTDSGTDSFPPVPPTEPPAAGAATVSLITEQQQPIKSFAKVDISDAFSFEDDNIPLVPLPVILADPLPPTSASSTSLTQLQSGVSKTKVDIHALLSPLPQRSELSPSTTTTTTTTTTSDSINHTSTHHSAVAVDDTEFGDFGAFESSSSSHIDSTTTSNNNNNNNNNNSYNNSSNAYNSNSVSMPIDDHSFDLFTSPPPSTITTTALTSSATGVKAGTRKFIRTSPSTGHLTIYELQTLVNVLLDLCLYHDAYICHQQLLIQTNIQQHIHTLKHTHNDPEYTNSTTRLIESETRKLISPRTENEWMSSIENCSVINTLESYYNIINNISKVMGNKIYTRYISNLPSIFTPLNEKVNYYIHANHSIYLIYKLLTTHLQYPDYWKSILLYVISYINDANKKYQNYDLLPSNIQGSILPSDIMCVYTKGIVEVAFIGMCVAASCLDAMVRYYL